MTLSKFPKGIIVSTTVKMYYKKYAYRICFTVDDDRIIKSNLVRGWYAPYTRTNLYSLQTELKRKIIDHLPDELDCKFRGEHKIVTMYLDDESIFNDLVERLHYCITEVSVPTNNSHKQLMMDNHRIRVRNTLFLKQYRYKVNIKNGWTWKFTEFDSLNSWLNSLENEDGTRWCASSPLASVLAMTPEQRAAPRFRYRYSSFSIYLNDEQDVMMLQLWLNNYYDGVEKAVLISET
jgi:hypothetical protein